jgi:hypothetical protein
MSGRATLATPARPLCEPSHRPPKKDRPKSLSFCSDNTVRRIAADIRNGSFSEVGARNRHVRFPPDSDQTADIAVGPFRAKLGSRWSFDLHDPSASSNPFASFRSSVSKPSVNQP